MKAKKQRAILEMRKGNWLAVELARQALSGASQSYGEHFPMPAGWGRARPYFDDPNSPEALAFHKAEEIAIAEVDEKWTDFCNFIEAIPLPEPSPRFNLDEEKQIVHDARARDDNDTLIALDIWLEQQEEWLRDKINATVERSYLQLVLDVVHAEIAKYLGIEPRQVKLGECTNTEKWLRAQGCRQ